MAARPLPSSALALCVRLAGNCRDRLVQAQASTMRALDNPWLTGRERAYYMKSYATANAMIELFAKIAALRVTPPPAAGPRRVGRPPKKVVEAAKKRANAGKRS